MSKYKNDGHEAEPVYEEELEARVRALEGALVTTSTVLELTFRQLAKLKGKTIDDQSHIVGGMLASYANDLEKAGFDYAAEYLRTHIAEMKEIYDNELNRPATAPEGASDAD